MSSTSTTSVLSDDISNTINIQFNDFKHSILLTPLLKLCIGDKNNVGKSTIFLQIAATLQEQYIYTQSAYTYTSSDKVADELRLLGSAEQFEVIHGLQLTDYFGYRMDSLSSGTLCKVMLAKVLLYGNVVMLNEPTNYLDIAAISWLSTYLALSKKIIIFISHDFEFVNQIANQVLYLGDVSGNHSFFHHVIGTGEKMMIYLKQQINTTFLEVYFARKMPARSNEHVKISKDYHQGVL